MTTSAIVWDGTVYIDTAGSGKAAANAIGEVVDFDAAWDVDMVEVTSRDSGDHKEYLAGLDGGQVSVTVRYLKSDSGGQDTLWTNFQNKTKFALRVNMDDDGSNNGYGIYGDGFLKSMPISSSVGDKVDLKFTFQFTGQITYDADSV